jgi:PAS domain S-box-containing protein
MRKDSFDQEVEAARQRLEALRLRAGASHAPQQESMVESLEELSSALEELHVAQEELRQQNEELVATRQAVEAERQRYQDLFESAPDGYLVTDAEGTIQEANRTTATLLQVDQDFLVGKPLVVFVLTEGRAPFHAHLTQLQTRPQPIRDWETYLQPRRAEPFPAAMTVATVCDAQGKVVALRWLLRDITERKQVEAAVQEARAYAESIVDTVREPLIVLDPKLRVVSANPSFYNLFQTTKEETEYCVIYDLGNRQWDIPQLRHLLEEIVPRNAAFDDFEVEHAFPTIGHRSMVLNARRVGRGAPQSHLILLAIEDITERKQAEKRLARQTEELARSNAELEQFAYVASHDLQEPLRKVASYTDLLAKRYQGQLDSRAHTFIAYIHDGATRMKALIDDLLTLSRIGNEEISLEQTDVEAVLREALAVLDTALQESGASVTFDPLPTTMANPSQLEQLLHNLIGNAIKFRGTEPTHIHVSAEQKNHQCVFSVQDNGIGIDPQDAERIFAVFQRLHSRAEYPGTGIGLAICKKIVEHHGGRIWLESQPGKGATFYFTLPEM